MTNRLAKYAALSCAFYYGRKILKGERILNHKNTARVVLCCLIYLFLTAGIFIYSVLKS